MQKSIFIDNLTNIQQFKTEQRYAWFPIREHKTGRILFGESYIKQTAITDTLTAVSNISMDRFIARWCNIVARRFEKLTGLRLNPYNLLSCINLWKDEMHFMDPNIFFEKLSSLLDGSEIFKSPVSFMLAVRMSDVANMAERDFSIPAKSIVSYHIYTDINNIEIEKKLHDLKSIQKHFPMDFENIFEDLIQLDTYTKNLEHSIHKVRVAELPQYMFDILMSSEYLQKLRYSMAHSCGTTIVTIWYEI